MFNIGDKLYFVNTKLNTFARQKIKMVDANGIEWYRYDKPVADITLETHTIVGSLEIKCHGEVPADEFTEATYYTDLGQALYANEVDNNSLKTWFTKEEEAMQYLEYQKVRYAD